MSQGLIQVMDESARFPLAGPIRGFSRTLANEMLELDVVWIDLDCHEDTMHQVKQVMAEMRNGQNTLGRSEEPFIAYRNKVRNVGKLVPLESPQDLSLPLGDNPIQLKLLESCSITDLEWDNSIQQNDMEFLKPGQVSSANYLLIL